MGHKELIVDNQYERRNGHLCKDLIVEEAEGMTSSYVLLKENIFCIYKGPLTACRRDWS